MYDELERLIELIETVYSWVSDQWEKQCSTRVNLKRSQIGSVEVGDTLYQSIMQYTRFLNEMGVSFAIQFAVSDSSKVSSRVKARNSIDFKLQSYKTEAHAFGKVAVNKSLNDLFGIRIVLNEPLTYEQISEFVKGKYKDRYKCIDSSKLDYKAVHVYFKFDNYSFPWELQIWNLSDRDSNLRSHKMYKQEYTTWEKNSKEGGIYND